MGEQEVRTEDGLTFTEEDAPLLRKVIAKRMLESTRNAPHFYLTVDVDMEKIISLRNELNAAGTRKISYNDILIKAIAVALKNHPRCNASYIDDKIRTYQQVNICLAVAIDGGLLTPAVRDCDRKTIEQISDDARELVEKARNKKLRPRESMGGTFTLSNLGMFGIEQFEAIINPPQALILACGAIREVPVVKDGAVTVGSRMKMTLSCDHRAVDGAMAAEFLADLVEFLGDPSRLTA
jgi:pyruvate dehydrogenase E2 component (dihydrolipoamide acetyltransferase)